MKNIQLESRGNYEKENYAKKETTTREKEGKPSYTHCEK